MPLQLTATDRRIADRKRCVYFHDGHRAASGSWQQFGPGHSDRIFRGVWRMQSCVPTFAGVGLRREAWEQPLSELPEAKGKILVLVQPFAFPASAEKQKVEAFVKSGGKVIAPGRFAAFYLPVDKSVPEPPVKTPWKRVLALSLSPITHAAPEITLASEAYWPPHGGTVGLYGEADKPVVVEYKLGEGGVLWLAGNGCILGCFFCCACQRSCCICILSQKSGEVRNAAERRKDMEAEMPALPFRIRERCVRVTPKRLEASATVISPK